MKLNRRPGMAAGGLLVAMFIAGAGFVRVAAGQTKPPAAQPKKPATTTAPKAAPKKAPVRPRVQTAPTRERIVEIQGALAREGFYAGAPSGKWDAKTTEAMKHFQTSKGLTATGKVGALSLQNLGLGSEIAGRGAPVPQAGEPPSVLSESELNEPESLDSSAN